MINTKMGAFLLTAFIAGAFVASPELRAYAANTVGSADIINNSILSADIKDAEVKTVDLGNDAVTSAKIKNGEVKTDDIAASAVGSSRIKDNDVKAQDIAPDAVEASEIAANAVGSSEIATDAVGTDEIAKDAVGASEIMGVDKLIFADCKVPAGFAGTTEGITIGFQCTIAGVDPEDNAIATLTGSNLSCLLFKDIEPGAGKVTIRLRSACSFNTSTQAGDTVSIIVYDELPDKIPPF